MYVGVFIDDQDADKRFADILSEGAVFSFTHIKPDKPITDLAEDILSNRKPDIIALDYRLDESPCGTDIDGHPNRYKAGPLAQQFRDLFLNDNSIDCPIILVSQEANIRTAYDPDRTAHNLFDAVFLKSEILNSPNDSRARILGLTRAYKTLIELWDDSDRLEAVLGNQVLHASLQDIESINSANAPHQLARSIFQYIISRNGLLIDIDNLMAKLGINVETSDVARLEQILQAESILYEGVFHEGWKRWWSVKVDDWAEVLCEQKIGTLGAQEITCLLSEKLNIHLEPARSQWQEDNNNPNFSLACAVCDRPTELDFSVPAYDPISFDFIQKKQICWNCVVMGLYEGKSLKIDESGIFISEKLENGKITKD